jgi:tetratricopeptide (TPR) repeat protein
MVEILRPSREIPVSRRLRAAVAIVLVAVTALPLPVLGQESPPQAAPQACKARSVVVLSIGVVTRESAEFHHRVADALSRYGCYKVRDVVDILEAGMGEGLGRVEEGRREAELGQQELTDVRMEEARGRFRAAVEAFSQGYAYLTYNGPLVDALMSLGVTEATTGEPERAERAFRDAIGLRPDLDVGDWSALAEARAAFDAARRRHDEAGTGALVLDSSPSEAEAWLDGRFVGVTPLDAPEVPAGTHWLVLRKPGWVRRTLVVQVPTSGTAAIGASQAELAPARRRPLFENAVAKLAKAGVDGDAGGAIEDVKALFLSDMALILDTKHADDGWVARLAVWDLTTMERLWTGVEPESGLAVELGRGGAENLVARAVATDEERFRVVESGAATMANETPVWKKWWLWTIIGAVVVGGTTAALVLTRDQGGERGMEHDGTGAVIVRF